MANRPFISVIYIVTVYQSKKFPACLIFYTLIDVLAHSPDGQLNKVEDQSKTLIITRNRLIYGFLAVVVLLMGLASRRYFGDIPFVKTYVGDVLWALMVFLFSAFIFNKWPAKLIALIAILFSFGVEISQLYHAPWLERVRSTTLGGLVLGFSFVWSDFICYASGVLIGIVIDLYVMPSQSGGQTKPVSASNTNANL